MNSGNESKKGDSDLRLEYRPNIRAIRIYKKKEDGTEHGIQYDIDGDTARNALKLTSKERSYEMQCAKLQRHLIIFQHMDMIVTDENNTRSQAISDKIITLLKGKKITLNDLKDAQDSPDEKGLIHYIASSKNYKIIWDYLAESSPPGLSLLLMTANFHRFSILDYALDNNNDDLLRMCSTHLKLAQIKDLFQLKQNGHFIKHILNKDNPIDQIKMLCTYKEFKKVSDVYIKAHRADVLSIAVTCKLTDIQYILQTYFSNAGAQAFFMLNEDLLTPFEIFSRQLNVARNGLRKEELDSDNEIDQFININISRLSNTELRSCLQKINEKLNEPPSEKKLEVTQDQKVILDKRQINIAASIKKLNELIQKYELEEKNPTPSTLQSTANSSAVELILPKAAETADNTTLSSSDKNSLLSTTRVSQKLNISLTASSNEAKNKPSSPKNATENMPLVSGTAKTTTSLVPAGSTTGPIKPKSKRYKHRNKRGR